MRENWRVRPAVPPAMSQHAVAVARAGQLDGEALPQPVHAAGHQVVHQVVLGGHGVEHLGHLLRLLAFRHVLVAEMGGRFCVMRFARVGHVTFAEKNVPGILNLNRRLISVELADAGKRSSGGMSQDGAGGDRVAGVGLSDRSMRGGEASPAAALL